MNEAEKNTWDKRYSSGDYKPRQKPSDLLTKWLDDFPPGKALDLACGTGRNALFLAEKGYEVTAIDISPTAIKLAKNKAMAKGLKINWIVADLDSFKICGQYDVISNFFHVNMKMVPDMIISLNIGGMLIYQHHMFPPFPFSEPHSNRFSFKPGELPQLFKDLKVLHYEEHQVDEEGGRHSYLATLVAKKEPFKAPVI
ncbi:methyltransferase domain-containing protein [Chloroflexota bacterium]